MPSPEAVKDRVAAVIDAYTTDPDRPLRQRAYQSPLRDERLAAWLGASLGILFSTCFVTGLFSHLHQHPLSWLPVPARPAGLFRFTQGLHVASGIASLPVLVAKLWVVWPRFVSFPPGRRVADAVERLGVLALVTGGIFMVFSGVANIAQWYPWRFSFTAAHYWTAWIVIGALVAHVGAKAPITGRALRPFRGTPPGPGGRRHRPPLADADPVLGTAAEGHHDGLDRRGFLVTVAAASGVLTLATIGQTLPGLRRLALLAPRDPADRPVNRSARNAGVVDAAASPEYRLRVEGRVATPLTFTADQLRALPAHSAELPIACVEGWSYSARWTGVRLRDLLQMAGAPPGAAVHVESLEQRSPYRVSLVNHSQAHDADTLLATHLDGEALSPDHGSPLRLIGPGRPGVNQTKWVTRVVVL
ncbi:MAG TPA: molybdopterin-dependent oxidoreductase [Acidimicrobiia bacterium]|nr:molybdopterin-dependent oxidoreductase [Acidimicrobiia bacterium]